MFCVLRIGWYHRIAEKIIPTWVGTRWRWAGHWHRWSEAPHSPPPPPMPFLPPHHGDCQPVTPSPHLTSCHTHRPLLPADLVTSFLSPDSALVGTFQLATVSKGCLRAALLRHLSANGCPYIINGVLPCVFIKECLY